MLWICRKKAAEITRVPYYCFITVDQIGTLLLSNIASLDRGYQYIKGFITVTICMFISSGYRTQLLATMSIDPKQVESQPTPLKDFRIETQKEKVEENRILRPRFCASDNGDINACPSSKTFSMKMTVPSIRTSMQ